ncbi:Alpha/Beta hydrolase protein [Dactylonectria estremocensis]|uniref:Alpha/Beta hydrolase protein n=1 Tax=Dactylonectria estremocensis TaxID=1079267 RepID=A0A9P9J061_9HYPO|nr:Alpha/Beta hydrolase protein [Dactylonectria estremocensis]
MASHGFLQFVRLKIIVSLIRLLNYLGTRRHFQPSAACNRKQVRIPSRDLGRFIDAWIYYPPNYREDLPRGLVINWHGGGYILPNLGMDHAFCERIARDSNVLVLDTDYRKGPEHPFPGAAEDAEDTLRWVESQPRLFDLGRIALSGFSSGANLALIASSELRREFKTLNIRAVYPFYPGVDFTIAPEDKSVPEPISPLPVRFQHILTDSYVPRLEDRKLPRASPMYAEVTSFPAHTILFVCSGDILAPEAEAFGQKLQQAGCDVEVVEVEGAAHGFDKMIKPSLYKAEETEMAYSKVVESLRQVM